MRSEVTLEVNAFAVDLTKAAANQVPNFMILGVLVGAYNPWDDHHDGNN